MKPEEYSMKYIEIGANLSDRMYQGEYNGSKKHEADLSAVLNRSWNAGLDYIMITGGSLKESKEAIELAKSDVRLFATVGCTRQGVMNFWSLWI